VEIKVRLCYKQDNIRNLEGGPMATKKKRKPNAAFMKPVQPDAALAAVVGAKPLPRTELTKKLWAYIKRNGLQDKKKKTNINADDKLKTVFGGKKTVTMFEMTKLVSRHVR
jgi:chromatin remodeling complex protein RSC6